VIHNYNRVGEIFWRNWKGEGKVSGDQVKQKINLDSFSKMVKYGHRGPNLALFFPRRGILQVKTSKAEMRVILVLNRDQLIEGGVIAEKNAGDT